MEEKLQGEKQNAYEQAIDSMTRYKFMMFGYWAAIWVHLNNLSNEKEPNPFKPFVHQARRLQQSEYKEVNGQI